MRHNRKTGEKTNERKTGKIVKKHKKKTGNITNGREKKTEKTTIDHEIDFPTIDWKEHNGI